MRQGATRSINSSSKCPSLWLLAASMCLCPAAAQAQTNTKLGEGALGSLTNGTNNTANGYYALGLTTTGGANTASGAAALYSNTTGRQNTARGFVALYSNTTGTHNTAGGYQALYSNTTGSRNVAVGASALYAINGTNNIALGTGAGERTTAGNHNIYIGHPGINGSESRVMRIGRAAQTKTFVAGIAGVPQSGATVVVRSNGQLGVVASSARYKQDIEPLGSVARGMAEKLAQLRPVSFRYTGEPEATHYGLIAEEVDRVMPELVVRDGENRPDSVQYVALIPLLLHQGKAQQAEIARQRALIERQQAALTELRRMIATRFAALDEVERAHGK